jgi:hypothetical protein
MVLHLSLANDSRFGPNFVPLRLCKHESSGPRETLIFSGFYMFFVALGELCLYSARRAWLAFLVRSRGAAAINSEEENETRWQNQ